MVSRGMKKIGVLSILIAAMVVVGCGKNPCKEYGEKMNACANELCKGKDKCEICKSVTSAEQQKKGMEMKCEGEVKERAEAGLKAFTSCDTDVSMMGLKKGMETMEGCK